MADILIAGAGLGGLAPLHVAVRDLSRGGAALECDVPLSVGVEVDVELPQSDHAVTGRVVRSEAGVLAVSFHQDPVALARIEVALDPISAARLAAWPLSNCRTYPPPHSSAAVKYWLRFRF
jgi:PilZ domain